MVQLSHYLELLAHELGEDLFLFLVLTWYVLLGYDFYGHNSACAHPAGFIHRPKFTLPELSLRVKLIVFCDVVNLFYVPHVLH